jgi:hypothetical protein
MTNIKPIVSDVSIGNATVLIDCEWLKCVRSFNFRLSQEEVPIVCDWADGKVTALRGNPTGEITIEAMNLNSTTLKWALDASVSTKSGDASVTCVKIEGIQWVPEDVATPTYWEAIINLNTPNVDNVVFYDDVGCTSDWASATTPLNIVTVTEDCYGLVTLRTNDLDEALDTLWVTFDYDIDYADGTEVITPGFSTFAEDHVVIAFHINATTSEYVIFTFPRCQIIPDANITFDNSNGVVTVPIKLAVLADTDFHPEAPLGWVNISTDLPDFLDDIV